MNKSDTTQRYPSFIVVLASWLVPGAGHFLVGRRGKGLLFCLCLSGLFLTGLYLKGNIFTPGGEDTQTFILSIFGTVGNLGLGLYYLLSLLFYRIAGEITYRYFEIGMLYSLTAGVLNYLIMVDAVDINRGRKP